MKVKKEIPEDFLGRNMWMSIRQYCKSISFALENQDEPLTFHHYIILKILYFHDEIVQQDIAEMMDQDKSSILRQLKMLEKRNLVTKLADTSDKRRNFIVLTEKGMKVTQNAIHVEKDKQANIMHGIKDKDFDVFSKVLFKIKENSSKN